MRSFAPFLALLLWGALAACGASAPPSRSDAGSSTPSDAGAAVSPADDHLRSSNVVAAHSAYTAALAANPNDSHAAFGAALTSLLLLPDDPAINALLDTCGQPHLNLSQQLFGQAGILAQDRDARRGSGTLTLATRQGPSAEWTPVAFAGDSYRTTAETITLPAQTDRRLRLQVLDHSFAGRETAELVLEVSYSNAVLEGLSPQRLADGLVVPADQFGGTLRVTLPSADGLVWDTYEHPVSGNLVFTKVGTGTAGDAIAVELINLELEGRPAACNGTCGPDAWPYLKLNGTLSDTVSGPIGLTLPFTELAGDEGPPHREPIIVLLDECPGLSAEMLREKALTLLGVLEEAANALAVVLADPNAEVFQFKIPGGLLYVEGDIPLNITDARVARASLDVLIALGRGVTQYRTVAKRFEELLGEYQLWLDAEAGPTARQERGFIVRAVTEELNAVFLDREPGFDVGQARQWLNAALADASLAMTREPKNKGLFNFQTPNAKSFAADFNAQIEFLQTTLLQPGLQGFPHAPDYMVDLDACFESPVDLQALRQSSTDGHGVFVLREGVSDAPSAWERNDRMELDRDGITRAFNPIFQLPADLSDKPCDATILCPGRYTCVPDTMSGETGHCQTPGFQFLDKDALKRAVPDSGDPAFINTEALRPLEALF
ncbi:MAG TPA: hypothetical protein VGK67_12185 [Myxococcales bacterium]|jgi:hypothetical protein